MSTSVQTLSYDCVDDTGRTKREETRSGRCRNGKMIEREREREREKERRREAYQGRRNEQSSIIKGRRQAPAIPKSFVLPVSRSLPSTGAIRRPAPYNLPLTASSAFTVFSSPKVAQISLADTWPSVRFKRIYGSCDDRHSKSSFEDVHRHEAIAKYKMAYNITRRGDRTFQTNKSEKQNLKYQRYRW